MQKFKMVRDLLFTVLTAGTLAVGAQTLQIENEQDTKVSNSEPVVEKPAVFSVAVEANEIAEIEPSRSMRPLPDSSDAPVPGISNGQKPEYPIYDLPAQDTFVPSQTVQTPDFNWRGAVVQSLLFLGIQHAFRMTEEKTRNELKGPFFRDWKDSVKNFEGWDDGGRFFTNYIAHPLQGSAVARIYLYNHRVGSTVEFGKNDQYWKTRAQALLWSTVWNVQFEIGPISEASLGNVGRVRSSDGKSKLAWVDMVMTPVGGIAMTIGEDVIDKYVLRKWVEGGADRRPSVLNKILRSFLTPTMAFSNLLRGHVPWWRDARQN